MFLERLWQGVTPRSINNPNVSLAEAVDDWNAFLGFGPSASGVTVTPRNAMTYSPVWRAVNLIARDIGKLPLFVYRRLDPTGKAREPDHPAYRLLRRKPNRYMTAIAFRSAITAHVLLWGNGYAFIARNANGEPIELLPLMPDVTSAVRVNGRLWYVTHVRGEPRKLTPANVLHLKGLAFDGVVGYGVVQLARHSIGAAMAKQEFAARYFANGASPSAVAEHPGQLEEEDYNRIRKSWSKIHQGLENAHRLAILEDGMKLKEFGSGARDAQLVESLEWSTRDVANWFHVPPHKLGDRTRTSFNSLEQENQKYLDEALDPYLVGWEQESGEKLLTTDQLERDSHFVAFVRAALVQADIKSRVEAYNKGMQGGWLSPDDIRDMEDMNPLPNGIGQVYFRPLNMVAVLPDGTLVAPPKAGGGNNGARELPAPTNTNAHRDALGDLVADAARRTARQLGQRARRISKRGGSAFFDWVDADLEHEQGASVVQAFEPIARALAAVDLTVRPLELLEGFRAAMLNACDCAEADLEARVAAAAKTFADAAADQAVAAVFGEVNDEAA